MKKKGPLGSFREALLGTEARQLVCELSRPKPLRVFYTYYQGKSRSHRLEFEKGRRTTFELYLPHYDQSISAFCSIKDKLGGHLIADQEIFSFWERVLIRLLKGKPVFCGHLLDGPQSSFQSRLGAAESTYAYRFAHCIRGTQQTIVLVAMRHSSQSSLFKKSQNMQYKWLSLSLTEVDLLVASLRRFTTGTEFAKIRQEEGLCRPSPLI